MDNDVKGKGRAVATERGRERSYFEHFEKRNRKIRYTVNKIRNGMRLDRIIGL